MSVDVGHKRAFPVGNKIGWGSSSIVARVTPPGKTVEARSKNAMDVCRWWDLLARYSTMTALNHKTLVLEEDRHTAPVICNLLQQKFDESICDVNFKFRL